MAKSIRLHEVKTTGNTATLSSGGFWENWFESHTQSHSGEQNLDEHNIWEKAVNFGVLAMEKAKG
jgi:hypothetical protein